MTRDPLNIGVRLTPELHAALSAEVSRRTSVDPDAGWTLSSVARSILRGALLGRAPVEAPTSTLAEASALPPVVARTTADNATAEPLCATCGEGLWHSCTRHCGRRTRTCVCEASVAADGVCSACSVDLAVAPPPKPRTVKRIAPDDVQDAARAEVRAWLAGEPARLVARGESETRAKAIADSGYGARGKLVSVAGTSDQNLRRWLNPNLRQRLPTAKIDAILAHIRANP